MPNTDGIYDKVQNEFDSDRCTNITQHGQCLMRKYKNLDRCYMHSRAELKERTKESIRLFRLAQHQVRVNEFKDHEHIKTLNSEIGILRLMVEEKLNACKTPTDLLIASQSISQLIQTISNLVINATRLETTYGQTMNKTQVDAFASKITEILSKHVSPEILETVANEISEAEKTILESTKE